VLPITIFFAGLKKKTNYWWYRNYNA